MKHKVTLRGNDYTFDDCCTIIQLSTSSAPRTDYIEMGKNLFEMTEEEATDAFTVWQDK